MKKNISLCLALFSLTLLSGISHGQSTLGDGKIVHEEEEYVVYDDQGKAKEKYFVGKQGDQQSELSNYLREKNLKYDVKEVGQPKLKFYDEKGKLIKTLDLSSTKSKGKIKETRPSYQKGEYEADLETVKRPIVSKSGRYAVMNNTTYATVGETRLETGKVVVYDAKGDIQFEKQFGLGRGILDMRMKISGSGTVAVLTAEIDEGPRNEKLYAYDKSGREILAYPDQKEEITIVALWTISSNGKYLAASAVFENRYQKSIFFNLENKMSWKADRDYVVYEISDSGEAKVNYYDEVRKKRSGLDFIDLEKRFKP